MKRPLSADRSSYAQIFRSSALIGGSSLLIIVIGIARTKLMALILGPAGIGLMGALTTVADLTRSIAGMGVNRSGVRQIAEAVGSGDSQRIAATAFVLRRTAVLLGLVGAVLLLLFATPIATLTFGSTEKTTAIMLLAVAVFFTLFADGQAALLQGMRQIGTLAKLNVIVALAGTLAAVPTVYFLGHDGVVVALGLIAALGASANWYFSRKVAVEPVSVSLRQLADGSSALLKLGIAFMASAFMMMGAAYVVRVLVLDHAGLDGAGFYQAAWTLGGLYVGFVLQAMGTDFYPRLVAQCNHHEAANRLVNEQAEISMLIAGPGVLATIVLAPALTTLLYTPEFVQAVDVLRWICVGMAMRVVTWPMGYIIVAKNRQMLFIGAEAAWTLVNVALSWFLIQHWSLNGAGVAFAASYAFHGLLIYPIVRRLTGFRWSADCKRGALTLVGTIAAVMMGYQLLTPLPALMLGLLVLLFSAAYSVRKLGLLLGSESMPKSILRLTARYRS